jgi:NDP-sugar pyrophosphorylase family protein
MRTKVKIKKKNNINNKKIKPPNDPFVSVVLLCDSAGYRMKSYGPISLINIGSKRLIDIQISAIQSAFKNFELIICLGFDSEKVCKYLKTKYHDLNIRIIENQLYNSSNSCESLRLSLNNISNDKVLICDGNLLITSKSLKLINTDHCCILIEKDACQTMEIGINLDNNLVQHFSFGAKDIWSEILFLHGRDTIESLRQIAVNYDSKTRFMFEALNELIIHNHTIHPIMNEHQIIKINNIKTYHTIKEKKV